MFTIVQELWIAQAVDQCNRPLAMIASTATCHRVDSGCSFATPQVVTRAGSTLTSLLD
ncbi:hypothetical protein HO173_009811 [Letharia columbiana]|uniref:Uncharacterized protein n=1 Tax=Letharia columbiana TaxID=112416 RepID=A0A8H6FP16_9LECA|nr:uncharacterized protein HO173_009811 [Letharia columbiana]KAF6231974.1 hypothetical protein HO173_009811 [Letharia columbiana]